MNDASPKRRPRISLLSLLLLTGLVAASITTGMLWREVGPLRAEVRRLRNEVGELSIADPTQLHAIRVETPNELEWKWRVWIPEGTRYQLRVCGDEIPEEGYPISMGTIAMEEPGEHVIRYVIRRDERHDQWPGTLEARGGSTGSYHQAWVEWTYRNRTVAGVGTSTVMKAPDEIVELARVRVAQDADKTSDLPDLTPGFVVWMEPF